MWYYNQNHVDKDWLKVYKSRLKLLKKVRRKLRNKLNDQISNICFTEMRANGVVRGKMWNCGTKIDFARAEKYVNKKFGDQGVSVEHSTYKNNHRNITSLIIRIK